MATDNLAVVRKLSVTIEKVEMVRPETPREDHLYYLSNLDTVESKLVKIVSLYVAKEEVKADPVKVIKESLGKVLDLYYPLAGRVGISVDGKMQVNYESQGMVFVEASTTARIDDLGDISKPDDRNLHELVFTTMPDAPTVQVTKFKCGGFAFGLFHDHAVLDGISAVEFLTAWSEIARGLSVSNPPFLDRSILKARSPPQIQFTHEEYTEIEVFSKNAQLSLDEIVYDSFCFTAEDLNALKEKVLTEGGISCSTFEALSAFIWKARTMALKLEPEQKTRLCVPVDVRRKFSPPLPAGFMGNGVCRTSAMTTSADLCGQPLHHIVIFVRNALARIKEDAYLRSAIDYLEVTRAKKPWTGTFVITTWSKLAFNTINFGWGEPSQSGAPVAPQEKLVVYFITHGKDRKSITVLVGLPPKVMEEFRKVVREF